MSALRCRRARLSQGRQWRPDGLLRRRPTTHLSSSGTCESPPPRRPASPRLRARCSLARHRTRQQAEFKKGRAWPGRGGCLNGLGWPDKSRPPARQFRLTSLHGTASGTACTARHAHGTPACTARLPARASVWAGGRVSCGRGRGRVRSRKRVGHLRHSSVWQARTTAAGCARALGDALRLPLPFGRRSAAGCRPAAATLGDVASLCLTEMPLIGEKS